jgi:hypothetical protein
MLAIQKQPKYFSKMVNMPDGTQALVVFELIERNGRLIAKAVYAEALNASSIQEQEVCLLDGEVCSVSITPEKNCFTTYTSPYFKDFAFLTSQLTRAPSL